MIDTDKYEGHTLSHPIHMDEPLHHKGEGKNITTEREMLCDGGIIGWLVMDDYPSADANAMLLADAPLLFEFIQKIVKDWCKPNQCNQAFGKDVRQLMYEYGLITFNEETRRYEVKK